MSMFRMQWEECRLLMLNILASISYRKTLSRFL